MLSRFEFAFSGSGSTGPLFFFGEESEISETWRFSLLRWRLCKTCLYPETPWRCLEHKSKALRALFLPFWLRNGPDPPFSPTKIKHRPDPLLQGCQMSKSSDQNREIVRIWLLQSERFYSGLRDQICKLWPQLSENDHILAKIVRKWDVRKFLPQTKMA